MDYLKFVVFFAIFLVPMFPPLATAGVDAVQRSYARFQTLVGK